MPWWVVSIRDLRVCYISMGVDVLSNRRVRKRECRYIGVDGPGRGCGRKRDFRCLGVGS